MTSAASTHYFASCRVGSDPTQWFLTAASMTPGPRFGLSRTTIDAKTYASPAEIDATERAGFDAIASQEGLGEIDWRSIEITQVSYRASRETFQWNALTSEVRDDTLDEAALEATLRAMIARAGPGRRQVAAAAGSLLACMTAFHAEEGEETHIPISLWGKDHWSTLAYVETVMVEHQGRFQVGWDPRLRQRSDRFSTFWRDLPQPLRSRSDSSEASGPIRGVAMTENHGTRLNDGRMLARHDDWDCIEDMVAAGLLIDEATGESERVEPGRTFTLSTFGRNMCSALRAHKASPGGRFATFREDFSDVRDELSA